jgi:hypothetical protein
MGNLIKDKPELTGSLSSLCRARDRRGVNCESRQAYLVNQGRNVKPLYQSKSIKITADFATETLKASMT